MIGLVIGAVGGFFAGKAQVPGEPYRLPPPPTPLPFVTIVIAVQKIPCGAQIKLPGVSKTSVQIALAPETSFQYLEDVLDKYVTVDVPREMPILSGMLVDSTDQVPDYCKSKS